jgi:N-acetylglucosaminyl-diphospho-decaprenol L-rhamnosyltransferase
VVDPVAPAASAERAASDGAATLAAVVVNHDAGDSLGSFLHSLRAENVTEVIVVDNASVDGSSNGVDADDGVRLVRTGANLGYGGGANRGLALTEAEFVLVSNPDVMVHAGALATLVGALSADPGLAIVGPRTLEADGRRYPSARRFPSLSVAAGHAVLGLLAPENRFSRRYRMTDLDPSADGRSDPSPVVPVDWVSGACFMARNRALKELGGFDESYFMYVEDLDLCWRAHRAGWAVAYVPGAAVTHLQGVSTGRRPYRMLLAHHRSVYHFASRRAEGWRRMGLPAVAVGLSVRLLVAWARQATGPRPKNERQGD